VKSVSISTEVSRRYRTNIVTGEANSVALKCLVSPIDKEAVDYYLIHYRDANSRKFISRQLYVDNDGCIIDILGRTQLMTTELSLIVKGYSSSDENIAIVSSPKIILVIQDSGEKHKCNKFDDREDGLLVQLKNVIETITMDDIIYYPKYNNIDLPAPVAIKSAYVSEDYHLHIVKTNDEDIDVGNVQGNMGPMPVKGVDYFTQEDIDELINQMDANARGTKVVEDISELPNIGNVNVIYIDKSENEMYRWDDTSGGYVKLSFDVNSIKIINGGGANGN